LIPDIKAAHFRAFAEEMINWTSQSFHVAIIWEEGVSLKIFVKQENDVIT
jgi:hypothetical protein